VSAAPGATVTVGDATVVNQTSVPLSLNRTGAQLYVTAPAGTAISLAGAACRPATGGNDALCTLSGANARIAVTAASAAGPAPAAPANPAAAQPAPVPGAVPPAAGVARPATPAQLPLALPRTGTDLHADQPVTPALLGALVALILAASGVMLALGRSPQRR
jgi:hypothetical protein